MIRRWGRSAVAIVALTLVLGVVSPAMAGSYTHRDARHDVDDSQRFGERPDRRAPHRWEADATALHVRYHENRIWIRVRLRSTSLQGLAWRELQVSLKTPHDRYMADWIQTRKGFQCSHFDTTTFTGFHMCSPGRVHREGRTIVLSIDRSWVGSPRWIRVAAKVAARQADHYFIDNVMAPGWHHMPWDIYSRRIRSS